MNKFYLKIQRATQRRVQNLTGKYKIIAKEKGILCFQ